MKTAKAAAVQEVRRFAKERDALFDKAKEHATGIMAKGWSVDELLKNPRRYLQMRFSALGREVVRELEPEARRVGGEHGDRAKELERSPSQPAKV